VIELRPWTVDDLPLLERLNEPLMTEHLGGPETTEQLERRLRRYVQAQSSSGRMFKVMEDARPVGGVCFWEREWNGDTIYETGWGTLPEFQGRSLATTAMGMLIALARVADRHRFMHAFPSIDNGPSNAICRKLDFELLGECRFEYPKGHWMQCNDWRFTLHQYT